MIDSTANPHGGSRSKNPRLRMLGVFMRSTFRTLTAVVISLMFVWIAGPAQAASLWGANDVRGDSAFGSDIKRTTLDVRKAGFYRIKIFGYHFTRVGLNVAIAYLDTRRANPGPEYEVEWGLPGDGVWDSPDDPIYDGNDFKEPLLRVDTWDDPDFTIAPCAGLQLARNLSTDVVTFLIPRACVGRPAQVRWNVETQRIISTHPDGSYDYYADGAPRWHGRTRRWVA